jgi:hypothetical protein
MALYSSVVFYTKLIVTYTTNYATCRIPDSSPSGMSVHFIPYRKIKSGEPGKKSGRLVTPVAWCLENIISFGTIDAGKLANPSSIRLG